MKQKLHHFLLCTEVTFIDKDGDTGITRLNTVAKNIAPWLGVKQIARAQQAAQLTLIQKLEHMQPIQVVNITIIAINNLGHMTDEQFNEGMSDLEAEAAAEKIATAPVAPVIDIFEKKPTEND